MKLMTRVMVRFALLMLLWLILMPSLLWYDFLFGVLTSFAATYLSLQLLPLGITKVRWLPLVMLLPRFIWQSVQAGWDVAWRAFHPKMPLSLGFVSYSTHLPQGLQRCTFSTLTSLIPGSLPCERHERRITYHALDIQIDHEMQLAAEEKLLHRVFVQDKTQP